MSGEKWIHLLLSIIVTLSLGSFAYITFQSRELTQLIEKNADARRAEIGRVNENLQIIRDRLIVIEQQIRRFHGVKSWEKAQQNNHLHDLRVP